MITEPLALSAHSKPVPTLPPHPRSGAGRARCLLGLTHPGGGGSENLMRSILSVGAQAAPVARKALPKQFDPPGVC